MKKSLVLLLLALGCASSNPSPKMDAETYIRNAGPRFASAFNAGNAATIAGFYTDDAILMEANQPLAKGSAVIREVFNQFIANKPVLNFAADRIVQSGDMAYEYGHYTLQMMSPAGGSTADQGNYVAVWRRQPNGEWKMAVDSIASTMPLR